MGLRYPISKVTQRRSEVWRMIILGACYALRNLIGITCSKYIHTVVQCDSLLTCLRHCDSRVRTNIWDGHVDFVVTAGSWPAFCYSKAERYSPTDIEKGLFRGELLVKVSLVTCSSLVLWYSNLLDLQIYFPVTFVTYWRLCCWVPPWTFEL